jgi:hypothetical protein
MQYPIFIHILYPPRASKFNQIHYYEQHWKLKSTHLLGDDINALRQIRTLVCNGM